jgi:ATP-dependent helicase/nuclease subunit A
MSPAAKKPGPNKKEAKPVAPPSPVARSPKPTTLVDQADRDAATIERARNVLMDAGAGTGKTTLLVARFVELLAPRDGSPGYPIERLAAVTFTRRAAGELRLRIREGILRAIADDATSDARRARLRTALGGLDAAWIGTIHSFADRLLRLEPMACNLSPDYEIMEDSDALHLETWHELLAASERGLLPKVVDGRVAPNVAEEAQATIIDALRVGLAAETVQYEFNDVWGLDALVSGFINRRDSPPNHTQAVPEPDFAAFAQTVKEFVKLVKPAGEASSAARFLKRAAKTLAALSEEAPPVEVFRVVRELIKASPDGITMKGHFKEDKAGWEAWKAWDQGVKVDGEVLPTYQARLQAPYARWMAVRLMRTFPVVVAVFEVLKNRRQVVDQVDLLLRLRDVLQAQPAVRARYQSLFAHLFVDEFQDTDPLQAEVLLYLCEDGQQAKHWKDVVLVPGKLTLVGDPKQSIYRFRRADVQMYDDVRRKVAESPCLSVSLRANFRSTAPLIDWFNHRFEEVLGHAEDGNPFDASTGAVFHAPLAATPKSPEGAQAPVWQLAIEPEDHRAGPARRFEAEAWARYFKWLVETRKAEVRDAFSGALRPVRYGDIAVLAHVTTNVHLLLEAFDRLGVPWSARGGTLFLEDPLHRQFLLGLRALANRDDGVAEMALLRPPFFAIDLTDIALERVEDCPPEVKARMAAVRELIKSLRRRRFERSPGDTARDLLESTGFGRFVALGPNGAQRLERLREMCFLLDRVAFESRLDFDVATARVRSWAIDEPPQFDAPHPVASEAVQVLSIHQAKGLEYPVVGLWDAQAKWTPQRDGAAWLVSRSGDEWAISLNAFKWSEPEASTWADREHAYAAAERRRLVYVAATRARDGLVIPRAGTSPSPASFVADMLLADAPTGTVEALDSWVEGQPEPEWARAKGGPTFERLPPAGTWAEAEQEAWRRAAKQAETAFMSPVAVSVEAHRVVEAMRAEDEDEVAEPPEKSREGRFGKAFGTTVHRALALALQDAALSADEAVRRAGAESGLTRNLTEAVEDVARTLVTLAAAGVRRGATDEWAVEYPVAWPKDEKLLGGFIDLLATRDRWRVIDFKTDAKPAGDPLAALPHYVEQVRTYARILEQGGLAPPGTVEAALLFTQDGSMVVVPRSDA